jgi:preprotein translocase subunit SecE
LVSAFFQELFHVGLYKRTQGRVTRQVTFSAVAVIVMAGLWRLYQNLEAGVVKWPGTWMESWGMAQNEALEAGIRQGLIYGLPFVLLLLGFWATYRLVNVPGFADFLIAVEAEMNKVSWPTRGELYRSSIVVLVTIFALALILFVFDFIWRTFFTYVGIL